MVQKSHSQPPNWMYKPNPCKWWDIKLPTSPVEVDSSFFPIFLTKGLVWNTSQFGGWDFWSSWSIKWYHYHLSQTPRPSLRLDSGYRGASPDHGFAVRTVEDPLGCGSLLGEHGSRAYGKSKPGTNSDTVGNHLDQNTVKMLRNVKDMSGMTLLSLHGEWDSDCDEFCGIVHQFPSVKLLSNRQREHQSNHML